MTKEELAIETGESLFCDGCDMDSTCCMCNMTEEEDFVREIDFVEVNEGTTHHDKCWKYHKECYELHMKNK